MVERDPNDDKNVIVEIRAGTGRRRGGAVRGRPVQDADALRRASAASRPRCLSQSPAEVGGFKEVTFAIKGDGAYSVFKYEGGTHRVQRVPKTESQGRIHTSTATVAVLPEAEEVEVEIDPNDLEIDVFRSTGPGGQSVNTTDSAVRITHRPTGIVVSMQDEKSQLQNREKAMRVLRARLYERALAEQRAEIDSERRAQVGSGERSEKIRTYNYPQGRVTDHRVKLTSHDLDAVLAGEPARVHGRARPARSAAGASRRRRRRDDAGGDDGRDRDPGARRARRRRRRRSRPPASTTRGSTPSCCSPRRRVGPRAARGRSGRRRSTPRRPARSPRWSAAGCAASRSPTSSARKGFRHLELASTVAL